MYSKVETNATTTPIRNALDMLVKAGLAEKVHHSSAQGLPLSAQANTSKFKGLPSDTGLMQRALGLDLPQWLTSSNSDVINKGNLAEVFAGLELIRNSNPHINPALHYWHRNHECSLGTG